ncbi:MAG TPA: hypothetical protein VNA28_08170 [Solirubrobacteraceae bacterium]|nr:hypothetical protein [Solirubrobacteraceae bacterium]
MEGLDELFAALRALLERHAASLAVIRDEPDHYQVQANRAGPSGTHMWFGAVHKREGHVSVHLMPVQSHPDLLDSLSDELRERMEGRSCFNFTPQDATPKLLGELSELVDLGVERYRADGLA